MNLIKCISYACIKFSDNKNQSKQFPADTNTVLFKHECSIRMIFPVHGNNMILKSAETIPALYTGSEWARNKGRDFTHLVT